MYQRVLVPLDGSKMAEQAIPYASELCKGSTTVTLFQVVHIPIPLAAPDASLAVPMPSQAELIQEAKTYLESIAAKLRLEGVRVDVDAVERDVVADAIVEYAAEHDIDLIVMTTHGRSGLSRMIFGSVAEAVVRNAPCPVLLIRAKA